jgi:hypothetical protein
MRTQLLQWSALVLGIALAGCSSSGPAPPRPGTPAFSWNGAQTTFRSGDVMRTSENLQQLIKSDNPFTVRARPWAIIVSAGIAQGFSELADTYDTGAKANRNNPMPFRRQSNTLRTMASGAALELAEGVHQFLAKDADPNVQLAFEYPPGSAAQPPGLAKVSGGLLVQESEAASLQNAMLQRGVVMALCRMAGNPDDTAKTVEMMKAPDARVPRATFLLAVAKSLYEQSALFGGTKLDRPDRLKVLCTQALECLREVPENKDTKQLADKIQASLKKIRAS